MKLRLALRTSSLVRCGRRLGNYRLLPVLNGPARSLDGLLQPDALDRLQQIVHRFEAKGLYRILVESGSEDDVRQVDIHLAELAHYSQTVQPRHLNVHEHQVRLQLLNQLDRLQTMPRRSQYLNIGKVLEQVHKLVLRQLLVVGDHRGE